MLWLLVKWGLGNHQHANHYAIVKIQMNTLDHPHLLIHVLKTPSAIWLTGKIPKIYFKW